jgi:hypothetical protein
METVRELIEWAEAQVAGGSHRRRAAGGRSLIDVRSREDVSSQGSRFPCWFARGFFGSDPSRRGRGRSAESLADQMRRSAIQHQTFLNTLKRM